MIDTPKHAAIVGVLLAAGASTRFGANKLMHPLPSGITMARASLDNLRAALASVIAVVRPGMPELAQCLRDGGAEVTVCERADEGMGISLAHAVAAAADARGWVVALADMPFVQPATIRQIATRLASGAGLVAPVWHGERGHPVGFALQFRDELLALRGDAGARALLRDRREALELIDCADAGVLQDIDTLHDLRRV